MAVAPSAQAAGIRRLSRPIAQEARALFVFAAEGEGFEPSDDVAAVNGFQDRRIQPLCHPSGRVRMIA
jgi:hypothetical protein